ncbi:ComEC/Rec2 family competence protein [Planomicrobium sp. CPCC 101079]|uniref:ComEC/Rec2 family competence protein n=1 Tax=Planomicrobium sp. CPCC 101079 TaxID=2599618 RepID=UPI001648B7EE|nr:MBL fold metallo-hydrolase [Planomicrobium sp. CPCC 101079]
MKKILTGMLCLLLLFGCSAEQAADSTENLELTFFKIGSADSMVLSAGNQTVLIDTGEDEDGEEIADYLKGEGIESIDALIITHFDKDHVGGADTVLKEVDVQQIFVPDYAEESEDYDEFLEAAENEDVPIEVLDEEVAFTAGSANFTIYPPEETEYEQDNDYSLAVSVQHGENRFLFAGDAEETRLAELMEQGDLAHTFLKVPHHGRYAENSSEFFSEVSPEIAVITSSDKNTEDEEVVAALEDLGADIYLTREGNIHMVSDEKSIEVTQ